MKTFDKKEKSDCSTSDDSPPQRPKRNTCQKSLGVTNGLLWREETDLKKALYASLQENKRKNLEDGDENPEEEEEEQEEQQQKNAPSKVEENGVEEGPKKAKVHAQRKFAQGSTPNSPILTPQKIPTINNSTTQLLPCRRPKTEDFLTFLCLRGTSILPPSLDFLNSCSKSDASSECRSLSPELDDFPSKHNDIKSEHVENGWARKTGACKASSKKYPDTSPAVKKPYLANSKNSKEVVSSKKRKLRDENVDPSNSKISSKTKSAGLSALREKYKKQRLAADKKKLLPAKSSNSCSSSQKLSANTNSKSKNKSTVLASKSAHKKTVKASPPVVQKTKLSKVEKKLAVEKRKSLRSADVRPKRLASLKKKTPWLRRAKLVPPIVDVESDSSEPEIIHTTPVKKASVPVPPPKKGSKPPDNLSGRHRSKQDTSKAKSRLTARQLLLKKHIQNRLKTKKSVLHSKNVKSRTIMKRTARQAVLKKVKKGLVLKTMSLRKDLQNKRVTRSAKHQIEEMFWSNPEKRSKLQNQKSKKKKPVIENQEATVRKQKHSGSSKTEASTKITKNTKDGLKRKLQSPPSVDSKDNKQSVTSKPSEMSTLPAKISRRSLSREEKQVPLTKTANHHPKSLSQTSTASESLSASDDLKVKSPVQSDSKKETKTVSVVAEDQNKALSASNQSITSPASKLLKIDDVKNNVNCEQDKVPSKVTVENNTIIKFDPKEKANNDLGSSQNSITVASDKNMENNLNNLLVPDKAGSKDISDILPLNVICREILFPTVDPCCSQSYQSNEIAINKAKDSVKEVNLLPEHKVSKKNNKKSLKKNNSKEDSKSSKRNHEKEKSGKKSEKNGLSSSKKSNSKERRSSKDVDLGSDKKSFHKKEGKIKLEKEGDTSERKKNKSNHDKKLMKAEKAYPHESKNSEKIHRKECSREKSPVPLTIKQSKVEVKAEIHHKHTNDKNSSDDVFVVRGSIPKADCTSFISDASIKTDIPSPSCSKDPHRNSLNSSSSSITNKETDDDSDYDLTLDQFIKLNALKAAHKADIVIAAPANDENFPQNAVSEIKDSKTNTKDSDKDSKSKKDGESSKHKKEKERKEQKTPKKEDKGSRKDPKALAKLLKKEKLKASKKEGKNKHKKDGSSSKSSKKSSEKDGSKSSKKDFDGALMISNTADSHLEHSESKKDKAKKESKLSRSSSCDETKSPKKKKKYNEFKDIEKIKNLISKSSILNEFSGFKEFKRRSSSEKSELKKAKKRKKLGLLTDKKLSKKLSAKLLKKYSKKKGLKSKKKLKKKELKEMKIADLESKILSKSKKQKHKLKDDHHHGKNSVEKKNFEVPISVTSSKTVHITSTTETTQFAKINESQTISYSNTSSDIINNPQTCSSSTSTVSTYIIESVPDVISPIEASSNQITQSISASAEQYVFSSTDELQGIVASDFTGVFEEAFPTGAILLTTRDSISQVPLHFIQDISVPKTMADAATNTGEDDIEESLEVVESLKSDEMSVGTQTMTPAGSPSPIVELQQLKLPPSIEFPPKVKVTPEVPSKSVVSVQPEAAPLKTAPIVAPNKSSTTPSKPVSTPNKPISTPNKPVSTPNKPVSTPNKPVSTPNKPILQKTVHEAKPTTPPKPKRRSSFAKKSKTQTFVLPEGQPFPLNSAKMVSAPVYYPSAEEFRDPMEYILKIKKEASQFGICKIVPPSSFKPECKVNDDMRFTAHNQYLHKMLHRWGPNVQHTACIKKHLKSQKVKLEQPPLIGGIELDISRFYHTVQQYGGLQQVIEKKKWQRVADSLRVPKTAQDRVTKLYDAYCRYLVSYDTLPYEEKEKLEKEVIADHERRVKFLNSSREAEKEDEDFYDDENTDCVSKGRSMTLSNFFRIARNTMSMWFKNGPSPAEVEHEYWKVVTEGEQHIVVHAGNIDSSVYQSGFACNRNSPFAKHPWNLKILTNNSGSILRCMGPVSGVTIPTLHVGMLFTTGCWYRDPHSLPWIEYLHTGASKIWYSIPAKGCEKFRESMKKIMPEHCTNNPIWLPSDTAMVPPELLVKHGASLSRTIQNSGQFVVIFPESFTSTICCGYCVSESVYFAPPSWLDLAVKAFEDIRNSCEPPSFSLERLLFSIANDPKTQPETLQKILPLIKNIRVKEMELRSELSDLGLKQCEKLPVPEVKDKKKKTKVDEESEQECEICRTLCYVSMVVNVPEDTIYCLPHALEHIPKKNLKLCKLAYTYVENEIKELEEKIIELISVHSAKLNAKKKSPKKKIIPPPEK